MRFCYPILPGRIVIEQTYSKKVEALFSPNLWRERTPKIMEYKFGGGGGVDTNEHC